MCYYATTDYACGDWKWGNMMLRCPRQHRIGETCGAKLVHHESVTKSSSICKTCEEMSTKQRRLVKTQENIARWSREPEKFSASLEKARRERSELEDKIRDLYYRRSSVATSISGTPEASSGNRATSTITAAPALPSVASLAASTAPRYEYTSSTAAMNRSQDNGCFTIPRNSTLPGVGLSNHTGPSSGTAGSHYPSLPTGIVSNRSTATVGSTSANVAVNRQKGGYVVSHARR